MIQLVDMRIMCHLCLVDWDAASLHLQSSSPVSFVFASEMVFATAVVSPIGIAVTV